MRGGNISSFNDSVFIYNNPEKFEAVIVGLKLVLAHNCGTLY